MVIKFYTDEHIHPAVVLGLRKQGIDILTAQETKMLGVPDKDHLEFATSQKMVMVTQDSDFLRLHQDIAHHGIVYVRQGTSIGEILQGLILIHHVLTVEEMQNHVEFL